VAADSPLADTCVCGSAAWHKLLGDRVLWCRKCGSTRPIFETHWHIPLDRAGDVPPPTFDAEEAPTKPGG
jgi:hypothetical protein